MDRDKISVEDFPKPVQSYTQFDGKRCALPMLADTYGLYYNKKLFAKAGLNDPPKTMSELADDARKLTAKDSDGKLEVVGYDPAQGFYENAPAHYAPLFGAQWVNADGKSSLAASPGWTSSSTGRRAWSTSTATTPCAAGRPAPARSSTAERVRAREARDEHGR